MKRLEWVDPSSVGDAVAALGAGGMAMAKAGGVDVMDLLKEELIAPERLVNLRSIKGLDGIDDGEQGLRLGPLVTLARIADDRGVRHRYRALADAAGHTATPQIRNMATLGGNLLQRPRCWYFRSSAFNCLKKGGSQCFAIPGENAYHAVIGNGVCAIVHPSTTAVALTALGAKLRIVGPRGAREVALESFFVAPETDVKRENALGSGEVITEVIVPPPRAGTRSAYIKQGQKESFDWPLAEVAVLLESEGSSSTQVCKRASIVLGAAAPVPWRARSAEAALVGRAVDATTATAAARAALAGAKPLSQNAYKLPLFEAVVRRTILAAQGSTT
jgi:xanthine dehydrogenase YagS FAD-binding subunit